MSEVLKTHPEDPPCPEGLKLETVAEILSNERRRYIIEILEDEEITTVKDMSERIAEKEVGGTPHARERNSVYVTLIQNHVPMMYKKGIVEYDECRKLIRRGEQYESILKALNTLKEHTDAASS